MNPVTRAWRAPWFFSYILFLAMFFHALVYRVLILVDRNLLRTCFVDVRNECRCLVQMYPDKRGETQCGPPIPRPAVTTMDTHNTGDFRHQQIRHKTQ